MTQSTRSRRIHSWASDRSPYYRYSLSILLLIFCVYGMKSGYLNPVGLLLAHYNMQIETVQKKQLAAIITRNECTQLHAELAQLHEQFDSHHRSTECGAKEHLLQILETARQTQLTLGSCGPVRETSQGWRTKKTIQTTVHGTLPQIIQFFSALQSDEIPMKCHTMSMTRDSDGKFSANCTLAALSLDVKNPST